MSRRAARSCAGASRCSRWRSASLLEFYNNLRKGADVSEDGLTTVYPAGFVHPPKIDAEFIQQLCAEQLITRRDRNGFPVREWQKDARAQ